MRRALARGGSREALRVRENSEALAARPQGVRNGLAGGVTSPDGDCPLEAVGRAVQKQLLLSEESVGVHEEKGGARCPVVGPMGPIGSTR